MSADPDSVRSRTGIPRRIASVLGSWIAAVYCAVTARIVSDARPGSHPGI